MTQWDSECSGFGSIKDLPVVTSSYKECRKLYLGGEVLDVGAGTQKTLQRALKLHDENYFSLDNDPNGVFDYNEIEDIPADKKFKLIVANQFFEHLQIDDCVYTMKALCNFLDSDGRFVITVPNMQHPVRFWGHALHITPWPFEHLYGLVRHCGFMVESIARYNKSSLPRNPFKRFVAKTVCDIFRIDWCDSIIIVARKKSQSM